MRKALRVKTMLLVPDEQRNGEAPTSHQDPAHTPIRYKLELLWRLQAVVQQS
jgi:hypothetical protein